MANYLGNVDADRIRRAVVNLACAYRTLLELMEYYADMDGFAEWERLNAIREWLEEALNKLVGAKQVQEWTEEAKSEDYSPFALRKLGK